MGTRLSSNVQMDLLLAPYPQYRQLDHLVVHVCYKASRNAWHSVLVPRPHPPGCGLGTRLGIL